MGFINAIKTCMVKFAQFEGRASRKEFWYFVLFLAIVQTVMANVAGWSAGQYGFSFGFYFGLHTNQPWHTNIYAAVFFIPFLTVLTRRFQDAGLSASRLIVYGFYVFVVIVFIVKLWPTFPYLQFLIITLLIVSFGYILYGTTKRSQSGPNKYGPNPHEDAV